MKSIIIEMYLMQWNSLYNTYYLQGEAECVLPGGPGSEWVCLSVTGCVHRAPAGQQAASSSH